MKNIEMNYYNGSSYEALYPQTKSDNLIGAIYQDSSNNKYTSYNFKSSNYLTYPVGLSLKPEQGNLLTLACLKGIQSYYTGTNVPTAPEITYGLNIQPKLLIITCRNVNSLCICVDGIGYSQVFNSATSVSTTYLKFDMAYRKFQLAVGSGTATANNIMNGQYGVYYYIVLSPIQTISTPLI